MNASQRIGRRVAVTTIVSAGALVMACSTGGRASGAGAAPKSDATASSSSSSRDALAGDELMNAAATNLFDALQTLRPEMLTGHGLGAPDVYIRDLREPKGIDRLKEIPLSQVQQVKYLKPEDARDLRGQQSQGGALVVTLR
jgi:hypothetical protein